MKGQNWLAMDLEFEKVVASNTSFEKPRKGLHNR